MKSLINPRILLFCALSLSLISWDRVSKDLAKEYLRNRPAKTYLHGGFRLEYVENTGAAMSLADNLNPLLSFWLLGILPLAILIGLFAYTIVHNRNIQTSRLMGSFPDLCRGYGQYPGQTALRPACHRLYKCGCCFTAVGYL